MKDHPVMTSNRPYLLRALYEWIVDHELTPYIVVLTDHPYVQVPGEYVEDGRIILNVAPSAALNLNISNSLVSFNASFGGRPMSIRAPVSMVSAIYAKENGKGMVFPEEDPMHFEASDIKAPDRVGISKTAKTKSGKPILTVVK